MQTTAPLGYLGFGDCGAGNFTQLTNAIHRRGLLHEFQIPAKSRSRKDHQGRILKRLIDESGRQMAAWTCIFAKTKFRSPTAGTFHFYFADSVDAVWAKLMLL